MDWIGLFFSWGCRECNVYGVLFFSNVFFNYNCGCIELSQCYCYCDGLWNCIQGCDICCNIWIIQFFSRDSSYSLLYSGGGFVFGSGGGFSYFSGLFGIFCSGVFGYFSGLFGFVLFFFVFGGFFFSSSLGRRGGGVGSSFGSFDFRCKQCYVIDSRVENLNMYFKY